MNEIKTYKTTIHSPHKINSQIGLFVLVTPGLKGSPDL